jgi:hypothetical protein
VEEALEGEVEWEVKAVRSLRSEARGWSDWSLDDGMVVWREELVGFGRVDSESAGVEDGSIATEFQWRLEREWIGFDVGMMSREFRRGSTESK